MEQSALVVGSSRDGQGVRLLDAMGRQLSQLPTTARVDRPRALCSIIKAGPTTHGGDYLVLAMAEKPTLHVYQYGKSQPALVCAAQEVLTALCSDPQGRHLFAGSKSGKMYVWNVVSGQLLHSWSAHFKAVSDVHATQDLLFSVAEDGLARVWCLHHILDAYHPQHHRLSPFRTWNCHTLAVKQMFVFAAGPVLRVWTCSLDRSVVLYDVSADRVCVRLALPAPLTTVTCTGLLDYCLVGATTGHIYAIEMSLLAVNANYTSHANVLRVDGAGTECVNTTFTESTLPPGVHCLAGHGPSSSITALVALADHTTLVSCGEDGLMKWWNVHTKQCLRELQPFPGHTSAPITTCMLTSRPEYTRLGVSKPSLCPIAALRKFPEQSQTQDAALHLIIENVLLPQHMPIVKCVSSAFGFPSAIGSDGSFGSQREFVALPLPVSSSAAGAGPRESEAISHDKALEERLQSLEHENQRWRKLCEEMREYIQTLQQSERSAEVMPDERSAIAGPGNSMEIEKEKAGSGHEHSALEVEVMEVSGNAEAEQEVVQGTSNQHRKKRRLQRRQDIKLRKSLTRLGTKTWVDHV